MNAAFRDLLHFTRSWADPALASALESYAEISGADPVVNTPFRVGEAGAAALAAQSAAMAHLWKLRNGRSQRVSVSVLEAALSLLSVGFLRQNGYLLGWGEPEYPTVDFYRCSDGRWIFLHGAYPLLRNGVLDLLGCPNNRAAIAKAVQNWKAEELEKKIAERGLTGAMLRTRDEWLTHPHGKALSALPPIEIIKIGESAPQPLGKADRPLSGVRVLDLTHVIAGPTATRAFAEQGADVLRITGPLRPAILPFLMDTGRGKLSGIMDLKQNPAAKDHLWELVRGADLFCQSYRPGAFDRLGFSPEALAAARPGIIYVTLSCYGGPGPWAARPGWEQLAQTVTGMAAEQGTPDAPKLSPVFPNDYITGYLTAYGALLALIRRSQEGGSYLVRASLCQTAMWLMNQGRVDSALLPPPVPGAAELARFTEEEHGPFGRLTHLRPAAHFSETPSRFSRPTAPQGAHECEWPR
jgi:crotonobetainyl-CoA:carnitine CoA-transferase CaiB-like acyl-CoA transferase